MEQRRYCAFISYRHYTPDKEVAQRLHSLIENYTIPSALRGEEGLKHPGRVFRDQEELPLSADLGKDIETALDNSDWLICVCSPRYLQSRWCMRELEYFIERRGRERVLAVLAEGEPQDAFPDLLCKGKDADGNEIDIEPLAADVRSATLQGSLKKLKKEKLRILAPMLGTTFDGLYMRQKRRARRNIAAIACAALVAAGGFMGYYNYQQRVMEQERAAQQAALENERITSARNECDLLLEQAAAAVNEYSKPQARELLLKARDLSDSIGGYREEALLTLLEKACYAGNMSREVKLDSAVDYFAVSADRSTEFFSPDGTKVLIPSSGYTLDCCDAFTGKLLWRSSFDQLITSARWSEDSGRVVATAHMAHNVRVIDAASGEVISDLKGISWVSDACFGGDKIYMIFQSGILIWDPETDPDAQNIAWYMDELYDQGTGGSVFHGQYVVKYDNEQIGIVDTEGPMWMYDRATPNKIINGYTLSPDGMKMFIHQYNEVFVCDVETDEILWSVQRDKSSSHINDIPESSGAGPVWAGDYIYDNERLDPMDYLGYTGTVYNANTGEVLYTLENECCRGATPDGRYFLCSTGAYEAATGERAAKSVSYLYDSDSDGKRYLSAGYILTGMGAGSQYTLGEYSGTLYHERNELHRTITPDDKYQVVWIPGNPTGYSKQGFTVVRMDGSNWQYNVMDFSPQYFITFTADSRLVALGSGNNGIGVYEVETGKCLYKSDAFYMRCFLNGFTFSSDGRYLMAAGKDGIGRQEDNYCYFVVADMDTGDTLYEMYPTKKAADWGFDETTGDAVVLYEDGSALCGDIFTSADELIAYARRLSADRAADR